MFKSPKHTDLERRIKQVFEKLEVYIPKHRSMKPSVALLAAQYTIVVSILVSILL